MLVAHVKPNTVEFTEVMVFRQVSRHERETPIQELPIQGVGSRDSTAVRRQQSRRQPLQPLQPNR
jgi:hypothetical protein